ncbi:sugar phosphate isomerase/epimerase family protein [Pseudogracilibacillus auburnensis]|uniref:sugar phosphate isomerase/epimerase family protein n=1 Tax=Pseudogracilibacillus auburnensis TaxID=1494959 RepID=UPI001A968E03|nr:TIM barrel protein [Pseudogracilibacillus auburnensis]MBO1004003.1 TIM barrel protein [Pseudogracilibacillus auburnensis]
MKYTIASFSFHGMLNEGKMDIFGYLESVKYRYHLNVADIWNMMLTSFDEDYLKKVREALDEKEMYVANLCVDDAEVWDTDPEARERFYQNALKNLHVAKILGAQTVRIDMGGKEAEMTDEQFEYTVMRYKEYCEIAQENGFMVGPENHWGASRIPENIRKVFEAVNHPAFGILLHFDNWDVDKENGDLLCAQYAFHTHLAAWVIPDCEEKLKLLQKVGYKGHLGIEHHSGKNEYSQVEWQLATARNTWNLMQAAERGE